MAQTVHFITRSNGEATFINHTFMVILGDKVDVSNADANACAPKGNWYSYVELCILLCLKLERYNL